MTRNIISIDDRGAVSVPNGKIMMRDYEIAELFGVMVPTVKGKIKTLLKNRHFNGCTYNMVSGSSLIPDCFDLEMVVAVAFSIDSYQADIFRKWILSKATDCKSIMNQIFIRVNNETSVKTLN